MPPATIPITTLPVLTQGAMQGDDVLPIVDIHDLSEAATGTTKRVTFNAMTYPSIPRDGRTVATVRAYLDNNAVFNVMDWGATGDGVTDDTAAVQACITATPAIGGCVLFPEGTYVITSTLTLPLDNIGGRTIVLRGQGEARLLNLAPPNTPTFRIGGTNSATLQRNIWFSGLTFVGNEDYPNHGIHARFCVDTVIRDCLFNCWGSAFYTDGGVFSFLFDDVKVWPSGRKHGVPTTDGTSSAFLFDTPVSGADFANTITIRDCLVEAGGRAIQLKSGYSSANGWVIERNLFEGLAGGDGWGIDAYGLKAATIIGLYTEANTPGTIGDADDYMIQLDSCSDVSVIGCTGSGLIRIRNGSQISVTDTICQKLDADNSNDAVHAVRVRVAVVGGPAAGFTNDSVNRVSWNCRGAGAVEGAYLGSRTVLEADTVGGRWLRGTTVTAGASTGDDIRANRSSLRWVDAAGTATTPRLYCDSFSLADAGVYDLGIRQFALLTINNNNGEFAQYVIRGAAGTATSLADPFTLYSNTKDNASTINVYYEAGTGSYNIQNNIGGARVFSVFVQSVSTG